MSFILTINDKNCKEHSTKVKNPNLDDINDALNNLKQNPNISIVLASNPPVDTFTLIKVSDFYDRTFYTEVQYEEDNTLYTYYRDIKSEKQLLDMLFNFISNIAPNINDWERSKDLGSYKFYKEYELRKLLRDNGYNAIATEFIPENEVRLDIKDVQIFLKYAKMNNIKTIFYCYNSVCESDFEISNTQTIYDGLGMHTTQNSSYNDLLDVAKTEIAAYVKKIEAIDFDQSAILELFCIDNGMVVSMQIIAPWIKKLTPAKQFLELLKTKYEAELLKKQSDRNAEKEIIREKLRTVLLNNSEFVLCTNQNLRKNFLKQFLMMQGNEQYRDAFSSDIGNIIWTDVQCFADITYSIYKQQLQNKHSN